MAQKRAKGIILMFLAAWHDKGSEAISLERGLGAGLLFYGMRVAWSL
jgi:hypothetical protein